MVIIAVAACAYRMKETARPPKVEKREERTQDTELRGALIIWKV